MSGWGRMEIEDFGDLVGDLTEGLKRASEESAEQIPHYICENLRAGLGADGSPLPENADATHEQKRRRGQGDTPGVAEGVLSDESRWRVTQTGPGEWTIEPPTERWDVVEILEDAHDFVVVAIPPEWADDWADRVRAQWERVR